MSGFRAPGFEFKRKYRANDDRVRGFFIPALGRAVAYDRTTGYFNSSALASVARGLAEFLANGGHMRLIAGADLDAKDVDALEQGRALDEIVAQRLLTDPIDGASIIVAQRLETLAWMVREGRLEIKIGVPTDDKGRPLTRAETHAYYHQKTGVLRDVNGDMLAFDGSNNESASGLRVNLEHFNVYPSWDQGAWDFYGSEIVEDFEAHWHDQVEHWRILPLPDAVRNHLIQRVAHHVAPPHARDPEAPSTPEPELSRPMDPSEDLGHLAFIAQAPRMEGGTGVGLVTAAIEPWPHQLRIAHQAVRTFPRSFLFADEVGLGKTIEAGLIFRELLLSGKAERILILVPASVIKQWQEELDEKFLLRVPRLDGGDFYYRRGGEDEPIDAPPGNPWGAFPVLLATSHLARRKARRAEIINAGPWDAVFVDEAHHARRSGGKDDGSPNALLALLQAMRAARSWRALYLASATPMQMHAHEAWDLLELLDLTPRWASNAHDFTRYYENLRTPANERDWGFLQRMLADHLTDDANEPPEGTKLHVQRQLPGLRGKRVIQFHERGLNTTTAGSLGSSELEAFDTWLRENTPMRRRVFRTTRSTLREYQATGLLDASTNIPVRDVADRFIALSEAEKRLYKRIEAYISRYYNVYKVGPGAQRALGFIMTIYRRRLTSSFLAIERSLKKRRDVLGGDRSPEELLDADDITAIETTALFDLDELASAKLNLSKEVQELDLFLAELAKRPPDESKMNQLHDDLATAFVSGQRTAIVFTQYTDTMHYIRDQLTSTYGERVACWSGDGGERWNPSTRSWQKIPKPELKNLFRASEEVKILIGTDSMSEGLNLQTSGFLVNYDMPWNFMRVEQRIGRIDRIGGQPRVRVHNYFYKDTVEEQIYSGIADDVDWFSDVVGPAQPVLGQIESVIERVAMQSDEGREHRLKEEIEGIKAQVEAAKNRPVTLEHVGGEPPIENELRPVMTLEQLERELTTLAPTAEWFAPVDGIRGLYELRLDGCGHRVTFRPSVLESNQGAQLLTYGSPILTALLKRAGVE